ncbi:MAG: HTTM domain-containing protein [Planctomycetota bacterium]
MVGSSSPVRPSVRGIDAASLAVFRIALGLITAGIGLRYFTKGWHRTHFIDPDFAFSYAGLSWLECHDPAVVHLRLFGIIAGGLCLAAGIWARRAAFLLFCLFTWQHLSDQALYLNHYHLLSILFLSASFIPLDRAYAWRPRGSVALVQRIHPAGLAWFRFVVGGVYVFAGIAKIGEDWLLRFEPLKSWFFACSGLPWIGPLLAHEATAGVASWAALFFDLLIPFLVLWPRTRRLAFATLLLFHLTTELIFPLGAFPWIMVASASLLLSPSYPRAWRLRFGRRLSPGDRDDAEIPSPKEFLRLRSTAKISMAAAAIFFVALPLRGLFLDGEMHWTEAGYRFSWRVMTMEKTGTLEFLVENQKGEILASVTPESILTPLQAAMARTQPDMIAQAAKEIARREKSRRGHPVRVRALSRVCLNGLPSRWLVDPKVNLAGVNPHRGQRFRIEKK